MSRQFSQDEARDIFARAAERQHATETHGEGLTLTELQEIGREAGLDPEHVAAAVAEAGQRPPELAVVVGVDVAPRATRLVAGEMTDAVWEQVVARLRATFGGQGIATDVGRIREWTSGSSSNLVLTAEPAPGGTMVTISTSRERDARSVRQMPLISVVASAALAVFLLAGGFPGHYPWLLPGLILLANLALALGSRQSLARWSWRRQGQFDGLMDQVELLARDAATAAVEVERAVPSGRLGDVDGEGAVSGRSGPPRRVRS